MQAHTRGLLHCGLAEVYYRTGRLGLVEGELRDAAHEAGRAVCYDPRQAARIYRCCAELARQVSTVNPAYARLLSYMAEVLARTAGAADQLLKQSAR